MGSPKTVLERYVAAFEQADTGALANVLAQDVTWEMPPDPVWLAGREEVAGFLATRMRDHGRLRAIPATANGQPAFAFYARHDDDLYHPHALHVLTVTGAGVSRIVAFSELRLFRLFGLPSVP